MAQRPTALRYRSRFGLVPCWNVVGMSPWVAVVQFYTVGKLIRCTVFVLSEVLYRYGNRGDELPIIGILTVIQVLWVRKSGRP